MADPSSWHYSTQSVDRIRAKIQILFDRYQKIFDQSICKSKDLGDILRFLPGVVVQRHMSVKGMANLYKIKPDLLERLIKSTPRRSLSGCHHPYFPYKLEDYLSTLLQDRDRSQLYYCDPMLQHILICRHILSLLDGSNTFDPHTYVFHLIRAFIFLNFDVLVMTSLITFTVTSITIYVLPPRFFYLHGTSPTTTLP